MRVKNLVFENFRNIKSRALTLESGLNLLYGDNAQGKTNTIEAVCFCALGKSPRSDKDKEMIAVSADYAKIGCVFESHYGEGRIDAVLLRNGKKSISVNSVPILRIGELMGYLNCVWFSPDELKLVKNGPAERRRFLDVDLCQTDRVYYYALSRYNRILTQRNNLLKENFKSENMESMLEIWDSQLVKEGTKLIVKRRAFVKGLAPYARDAHLKLTDGKEVLNAQYISQIEGESKEEIAESFKRLLIKSREKDMSQRFTTAGAQRDDVRLDVSGVDVRVYGSQGQQRTSALSLKLAEVKVFKEMTGDAPILLLDDVLSELDEGRQRRLLNYDGEMQTILTTTHYDKKAMPPSFASFKVSGGSFIAE